MNTRALRSTTAILVALSLMQPFAAMAQLATVSGEGIVSGFGLHKQSTDTRPTEDICAEAGISDALACELHIQEQQALIGTEGSVTTDADASATVDVETQDAPAEIGAATEPSIAEEPVTPAEPAAEAPVVVEPEAPVEPGAEAPVDAEADVPAEPVADAPAETIGEAPVEAEADAPVEPVADAPVVSEPEAPTETIGEAPVEAEADAPTEPLAEAPIQPVTDAPSVAAPEAPAEALTEAPVAVDPGLAISLGQDCLAQVLGSASADGCGEALSSGTLDAMAAGTDAEAGVSADVTTETVTDSSSRSSGEEFREWSPESAIGGQAESTVAASEQRSGLSDLERAGLFALGALVVGSVLTSGQRVDANTGDRVVVVDGDGTYQLLKDDDALLRQPGSEVRTERYADGTTRTVVTQADGGRIVTIRDASGRALRRVHIDQNGREYVLFDDTRVVEPVDVRTLPAPTYDSFDYRATTDRDSLRLALLAADQSAASRGFSLRQVREYKEVRDLAPEINLENITFATNSSAIRASQAEQLREMGLLMRDMILDNPTELFLIEGHTDAVGDAGYNLLLSDRRAESAALALSEYFNVPAENMVVQGYGERYPRIRTQAAEELNRRVAVRRITGLVRRP